MLLESEGIHVAVNDEYTVQMDWALSNAIGGMKLKVKAEDADRARTVLKDTLYDQVDPELEERVIKSKSLFKWAILLTIFTVAGVKLFGWEWGDALSCIVLVVPIWLLLNVIFASRKKRTLEL